MKVVFSIITLFAAPATAFSTVGTAFNRNSATATSTLTSSLGMAPKGFGKQEEKPIKEQSAGQADREQKSNKYDELASQGGQEYNIFVRKFGGDDQSWFPCGAIAVPRGAQVSDAIFANTDGLRTAIVRTYPKLAGEEEDFEFGYALKMFPDDPVEVAFKGSPKSSGPSLGNWISNVLSPIDNSKMN